jgi:hypothetical protein
MIGWGEGVMSRMVDNAWRHRSHRSLRDGSCLALTRHFMPGYPRFVPPGLLAIRELTRAKSWIDKLHRRLLGLPDRAFFPALCM